MLGAPGSGKGTQGKILGTTPGWIHCSCGDIFRSLDANSELGKEFISYSSQGLLVPDELTVRLWHHQIDTWVDAEIFNPERDILILDGIPRNVAQAEMLSEFANVELVMHLACPNREELARRIRRRALKENRLDDVCDTVIQKRMQTYQEETKAILDYYPAEVIREIDGTPHPLSVLNAVSSAIIEADFWKKLHVK